MKETLSNNKKEFIICFEDKLEKVFESFNWEFTDKNLQDITNNINNICESLISNGSIHSAKPKLDIISDDMTVLTTDFEYGDEHKNVVHEFTIYRNGTNLSN